MGYIYKITNDINNKVYVGKTLSTVEKRWNTHCNDARKKRLSEIRPLYRAMNKYGIEHFKIETIGEYNDEILSDMENYWIEHYHGFTDGYNATKGGDGKQLFNHNAIYEELLKNPYPKLVAEKFHCSTDLVREIAKQNGIKIKNISHEQAKIKVNCYDKNSGEFIASFESFMDAARWCYENGKSSKSVTGNSYHIIVASRPNSNRKTAYGYVWKVADETNP